MKIRMIQTPFLCAATLLTGCADDPKSSDSGKQIIIPTKIVNKSNVAEFSATLNQLRGK